MHTDVTRRERRAASRSQAIVRGSPGRLADPPTAGDHQRVDRAAACLQGAIRHERKSARGAIGPGSAATSSRSYAGAVAARCACENTSDGPMTSRA